jgi:hypothetical protein
LEEPLSGPDSPWKRKLEQKEFKNGWRCSVHQKKYENKADLLRVDSSFKGIKMEGFLNYFLKPPPGQASMIKEMRTIEQIDENTSI